MLAASMLTSEEPPLLFWNKQSLLCPLFFWRPKKFGLNRLTSQTFYRRSIESLLTGHFAGLAALCPQPQDSPESGNNSRADHWQGDLCHSGRLPHTTPVSKAWMIIVVCCHPAQKLLPCCRLADRVRAWTCVILLGVEASWHLRPELNSLYTNMTLPLII